MPVLNRPSRDSSAWWQSKPTDLGRLQRQIQALLVACSECHGERKWAFESTILGSNASILHDLEIGGSATIAGNTLVVDHVPAHATAIGVPATVLDPHAASAPVAPAGATSEHSTPRGDRALSADLHRALLSIAERILGTASVEVQRNFFDAGGTSLKMLQLCDRVREELGVSNTLVDVYRHPTVQVLARFIGGHSTGVEVVDDACRRAAMRRERLRL